MLCKALKFSWGRGAVLWGNINTSGYWLTRKMMLLLVLGWRWVCKENKWIWVYHQSVIGTRYFSDNFMKYYLFELVKLFLEMFWKKSRKNVISRAGSDNLLGCSLNMHISFWLQYEHARLLPQCYLYLTAKVYFYNILRIKNNLPDCLRMCM